MLRIFDYRKSTICKEDLERERDIEAFLEIKWGNKESQKIAELLSNNAILSQQFNKIILRRSKKGYYFSIFEMPTSGAM